MVDRGIRDGTVFRNELESQRSLIWPVTGRCAPGAVSSALVQRPAHIGAVRVTHPPAALSNYEAHEYEGRERDRPHS